MFLIRAVYLTVLFACLFQRPALAAKFSQSAKIIGVTPEKIKHSAHYKTDFDSPKSDFSYYILKNDYISALEKSCAKYNIIISIIPFVKTSSEAKKIAENFDGLLLSGELKIDFHDYTKHNIDQAMVYDSKIDKLRLFAEINLIKYFTEAKKPILAIASGAQLINVFRGGTLKTFPVNEKDISYLENHNKFCRINIEKNTKFASIIDNLNGLWIDCFNYKNIDKLGQNLKIGAQTSDGKIQVIEATDHPFLFGVQWRAELLKNKHDIKIFDAFCQAVANL